MAPPPVFLERRSYRRRRMLDAVRLLPFLGLALWMVPLMWGLPQEPGTQDPVPMRTALQYVFGIWVLLVSLGWALSHALRPGTDPTPPQAE